MAHSLIDVVITTDKRSIMRLALYQPDIPQNTGTILRLAACFGTEIDIIGPTGFDMSDRSLKRAALDYVSHVVIQRHTSFQQFVASREQERPMSRLVLLTTKASQSIYAFNFQPHDTLLLGRESAGVPDHIHEAADAQVVVPIRAPLRSLNVAVTAAIALSEALRQTGHFGSANGGDGRLSYS